MVTISTSQSEYVVLTGDFEGRTKVLQQVERGYLMPRMDSNIKVHESNLPAINI